jgi:DNA-binding transcriptional ArsR family regulator
MNKVPKFIFSESEMDILTSKFRILSEESRLKILQILQQSEKSVNEIVEETGYMQANVSKQLKLLAQGGIVTFRTVGKLHLYKIADDQVLRICKAICNKT